LNDRTASRFGRRKPYIFGGTIVASVLYVVFPNVRTVLPLFMPVLFGINFAMASFRGPAVSLMPDLVPPEDRSKGNGIVTFSQTSTPSWGRSCSVRSLTRSGSR
jgi:MFS family permease